MPVTREVEKGIKIGNSYRQAKSLAKSLDFLIMKKEAVAVRAVHTGYDNIFFWEILYSV